jgi:transporter family-2 protein
MVKLLYLFLVFFGGAGMSLQASLNSALGKRIGSLEATFINFFMGTVFIFLISTFFGKGNLLHVVDAPKWQLLGGFLGIITITAIILSVPHIGSTSVFLALICGQILISMIIDHYGFFGVPTIPINWERILGFIMMLIGLIFISRSSI